MDNFIEEYLVAIGAKTDSQSFNDAISSVKKLENSLHSLKRAAVATSVVGFFVSISKAAIDTMQQVAKTDMAYMKLARSMWVTKETAKSLQMAMDEMGASMQDIAWIPELRDQFFRLREEINKFSTPADADNQLKFIRNIGYDIQVLMIRLKMLREWIVYYLVKYLKPFMDEFKAFINWVSDQIGGRMSTVAKKFAQIMGSIIGSIYSAFKIASKVIQSVVQWIAELPANVKKWAAIFSAVGAAIMAGPFGILLAAIGAAFVLLQDFVYYMNGWSSSRSLAPMWEMLLKFTRGTGSDIMTKIKEFLSDVADILDEIINGLNIQEVFNNVRDAVLEIVDAFKTLWEVNIKQFKEFFKLLGIGKPEIQSFVSTLAKGIAMGIKNMAEFIKLVGRVVKAAALIRQGEFSKAAGLFKDSVVEFGSNVWNNMKQFWGGVAGGVGSAIVNRASSFSRGFQWLDPTGQNTDPRNQCASFASQMMAGAGAPVSVTMNGDDLAGQFKREGAYHSADSGYVPQPGDLIDWAHHVGIYAGNGEYIARNSSGGVMRGSMAGMEQHFGKLWGFGSVSELQAAKNGGNNLYSGSFAESGLVEGSNEMAFHPFTSGSYGWNGFNLGGITIGEINIGGTNATPKDIAAAVQDGVVKAIDARYQRGLSI